MEICTEIDLDKNLRRQTVTGIINVPELMNNLSELYQSADYDPNLNVLWDLGTADFSTVTNEQIQSLMEMVKSSWGQEDGGKAALVATGDLNFGLTRMYELSLGASTSRHIRVFKNSSDAEKWLEE